MLTRLGRHTAYRAFSFFSTGAFAAPTRSSHVSQWRTPIDGLFRLLLAASLLATSAGVAAAQAPPPGPPPAPQAPTASAPTDGWSFSLRDVARVETWDFFTPRPGGGDPTSTHLGNRLTLGAAWRQGKWTAQGQLQYVQFVGLPSNAIGPGPLGTGALYYDHSGDRNARQVYLRTLTLAGRDVAPGLDVVVGRQAYASGGEHASGDAALERIKRLRLDARLIGDFDWAIYQRAFDGARVDYRRRGWRLTGAAFQPTQGGFEDAAGVSIDDIRVLSAAVSPPLGAIAPRTDVQLFLHHYRDTREVTQRPDNTGRSATAVDVSIPTWGVSAVGRYPVGAVAVDTVGWLAVQRGQWYEQRHRAWNLATEAGVQWTTAPWQPWLRVAWMHGSGDDQAGDDRHGTFFPVLPTVRKYALSTLHSTANIDDLFVQAIVRPTPRLMVRGEAHRLRLASAADRWYAGAGATQQRGRLFGLVARPSGGETGLGRVVEGMADYTINRHLSVNGYVGHMRGGPVVQSLFEGRRLTYAYFETVVSY